MSRDWFDPLGIRGSRLDPMTWLSGALRGEGLAGQSAERFATTVAQRLVGRRIEVAGDPPMSATVAVVDEVTPATALAAVPSSVGEVPVWTRLRARLADVQVGSGDLGRVRVDATDVRMVGSTSTRLRIGRVELASSTEIAAVTEWMEGRIGAARVRVHDQRIEVSERRLARWVWVEVEVAAADRRVVVRPVQLRVFGRAVPTPARLRRPIEREVSWLPEEVVVREVRVVGDRVEAAGHAEDVLAPVDVARVLQELGTEGTRSVLRVMTFDL